MILPHGYCTGRMIPWSVLTIARGDGEAWEEIGSGALTLLAARQTVDLVSWFFFKVRRN